MKKASINQIKVGSILSYINLGIGNLIPFFYTPIMLELLGQSEYGLYKMASSTTSYLSLMALGIGGAISRFIIKARTQEGKEAEERVLGLFNIIYKTIAVLTLLVGGVLTWKLDLIYGDSLTQEELYRMRILVALMVVNTAISFSATPYNVEVSAHERFIFIHCINVITTIAAPALSLAVLYMGYRSTGMAIVSLMLNILARLIYLLYVRRALHIRPRYDSLPTGVIRSIMAFSLWVFVSDIVGQIYSATDTVIIGMIPKLATTGVAVYSIGTTFSGIMFQLAQIMPTLFTPKVNQMVFSGCDNHSLTDLMIKVGRLQAFVVALACSGFIAFGGPFLDCYVGADYNEAYWVAVIIMIPNCIPLVQSIAHSVLYAKNMHKFRAVVYLGIACLNILGTLALVNTFGIIGAAIPTGISYALGHGLIMNWYYWKKVKLDIPRFWKNLLPVFLLAAVMCVITLGISRWIHFDNWTSLAVGICIYTLVYVFAMWKFVINSEEKNMLFGEVTKRFRRKDK